MIIFLLCLITFCNSIELYVNNSIRPNNNNETTKYKEISYCDMKNVKDVITSSS